ncbi:MAG: ABC transporter permease [Nocardioidaceae bacterium]
MTLIWLRGLLTRRTGRLFAAAVGIAIAVALFASLGSFLTASRATMTERAARSIAVDWQVKVTSPHQVNAVRQRVLADPAAQQALAVGYALTSGLSAHAGGTTQATGPGMVLGLPTGYDQTFPGTIRLLTGSKDGVLVAQQTAANLHVQPGDKIAIGRTGLSPVTVTVAGVVELPQADSLFQRVGAPPQSQPVAPPDNVVLLPKSTYDSAFQPLAAARPDLVTTEIHVSLSHNLPADPAAAFTAVTAEANNLEAATSGAGVVGNNLGAALDAARQDALYSQILFLFLGAPGALLAGALSAAVSASGSTRRRQEQALLRIRGATGSQLGRLVMLEAAVTAGVGGVLGLLAAAVVGVTSFGGVGLGASRGASIVWAAGALLLGFVISAAVIWLPAQRDLRQTSAADAMTTVKRARKPLWQRFGLDIVLLAGALLVFWTTSRNKYTLVLAPEGLPTISVNYWAFLAPGLAWLGAALLAWRVCDAVLDRGRGLVARALRPSTGNLATTASSMMARQRRVIARSAVLVGLALAFAMSTATFNATYKQQAEVDAQLTNGADVTATESPGSATPPSEASQIKSVPGVQAVEPLQHRFAYVGADLQDLYGVDASTIGNATSLQDAYFQGGTAKEILQRLATTPNGVLVSAETVLDYRLHIGDLIRLRLNDSVSGTTKMVPFHYVGVVNEFPTAPKDSFLVANASYVAQQTGSNAVGAFLVDTGGTNTKAVAANVQKVVGTQAVVTDISHARGLVGSSLTSVDLSGLSRIELVFALLIAAAAGGLVTGLGFTERRRSLAIASALGASPKQLRHLMSGEPAFVIIGGLVTGGLIGWGLSELLVKILTGVFDPPPSHLAVPWTYLIVAATSAVATVAGAAAAVGRRTRLHARDQLREL